MSKIKIHNLALYQLKNLFQLNIGFNLIDAIDNNIVTIELTDPEVTNIMFTDYGITFTFEGECYCTFHHSDFSSISIL